MREKIKCEADKTLKKLGFPVQEYEDYPENSLPKVIVCFTKRLTKLGQLQADLEKAMPPSPAPHASKEEKEKYEKCIRKKILVPALYFCVVQVILYIYIYAVKFSLYNVYYVYTLSNPRMLGKLQLLADRMDGINEEMSDLKTMGIVEGWTQ